MVLPCVIDILVTAYQIRVTHDSLILQAIIESHPEP